MPGSVIASAVISSPVAMPCSQRSRCCLVAVAQEVGQADVVVQGDPEAEAADAGALGLLADDQVEAEVLRAGAAVALRYRHAEEAAAAGQREDLARHDPGALPLPVASLIADHLALEERVKARPEVFVYVLEQRAPHIAGTLPSRAGRPPVAAQAAIRSRCSSGSGADGGFSRYPGFASSSCTSWIRRSRKPASQ